jgi:ProP effector
LQAIKHDIAAAGIALLAEQFPKCFAVYAARRKPLKLGIHNDIIAALDGAMTAQEIRQTLRFYTGNVVYLRSLRTGTHRIDLDGVPVGTVTADEAQDAKQKLAKRRKPKPPAQIREEKKRDGLADLKAAARRRREAAL